MAGGGGHLYLLWRKSGGGNRAPVVAVVYWHAAGIAWHLARVIMIILNFAVRNGNMSSWRYQESGVLEAVVVARNQYIVK